MDPFDDLLPVAPVARTRPGAKFVPKAKPKQRRKEVPASEPATSPKDGLSGNECQNAIASALTVPADESMESIHHSQVEFPNSERGNPKQIREEGDSAALVDDSTITASGVDADQNSPNFLESTLEPDAADFDGDSVTNFVSETNLNNGTTQPVHPANAVEIKLNDVAAPSTTCSTIDRMKEPTKNGEGSFLHNNKCLELNDSSLQVGMDLGFKSASYNKVAIIQTVDSKSNFGKGQEVVSAEIELDPFSDILPDPPARNVHKFKPKIKPRPRVGNTPAIASASSNLMMEKPVELPTSCMNDFQSFQSSCILNESTSLPLSTSEILRTNDLPNKFDDTRSNIPISEDSKSLAAAIPSQSDSLNAMLSEDAIHNSARDWPSSFGKSSGEAADIFSGLESLDDFLTQAATDTGKPALHSFNEKGAEENFVTPACSSINSFGNSDTIQVQRCPEYHTPQDPLTFKEAAVLNENDTHTNSRMLETEEIVDLNPACPGDDVFDYHSMKSGEDPTSGIPVNEELTNAADNPTLADFLHANTIREKERKNYGSVSCSLRKNRRSSIVGEEEDNGGKTSRQLRKRAAHKPANSLLNEVEDDNDLDPPYHSNEHELQENDDDYEVEYISKKKRVSKGSQKKSVAKSGKTSQKRKKADDDVQKTNEPPKKFSHSTRRKKRCVNKALLEIPEDELDPRTLPFKDIILLAEHRERQAKKEAMASNTSSTNRSGEDPFHETGEYNEQEFSGSEDGRDPYDDQANERITSSSSLCNYQSYMKKAARGHWSTQDTELFYEAIRELGTDFSMIQQLFPDKTRQQIKSKYKKEEKEHYLRLRDAIYNRAKDLSHYNLLIERLQQASTKAEVDPSRDSSDFMTAEEVVDLTARTNEEFAEVATTKQEADVKAQEDSVAVECPEQSDDSEDDSLKWAEYKSLY